MVLAWLNANVIWTVVQPLLVFAAPKFVVIKDWRLGLLLRIFQVIIFGYVLFTIFREASYQITEVPNGIVTPLAQFPDDDRLALFNRFANIDRAQLLETATYCSNNTFNFEWNGQTFEDIRCALLDLSSLAARGETEFFFATFMSLNKFMWVRNNDDGSCPDPDVESEREGSDLPVGSTLLNLTPNGDNAVCLYQNIEQYFPIEPEAGTLSFLHSYQTSTTIGKEGSLPRTILQAPGFKENEDERIEFEEGKAVTLNLTQWLDLAGVKLDQTLDDQPNKQFAATRENEDVLGSGDFDGEFPRARVSGVQIVLTLNYYQGNTAPSAFRDLVGGGANDAFCVIDVEPRFQWTVQGSDTRYMINSPRDPIFLQFDGEDKQRSDSNVVGSTVDFQRNGIRFTFKVQGQLGKFQFSELINALVAGSVLLSVAQVVVTFVALYALGLSSKLYMEFMRESCEWRKEYARFAVQALVAGYAFMRYDSNDSWKLDRTEIYRTLKKLLGKRLKDEKLAALADFMMRQSEEDDDVMKGKFKLENYVPKNNSVSIEEWVDMFTEDKVHLESLERLIDHEYQDETTNKVLVKLAEGEKASVVMEEYKEGILEEEPLVGNGDVADGTEPPKASKQSLMKGKPSSDLEAGDKK